MVVVADDGMLSAGNLKDLDEAGLRFIVGSRVTKAPADLASHFRWHGDAFTDGQLIDTITPRVATKAATAVNDVKKKAEPIWDPKVHTKSWRAVWAYSRKRAARDGRTLTLQENRARAVVAGEKAARTPRFVTTKHGTQTLDEASLARARRLAGLKGYVTNIPAEVMPAAEVIASYHDLWQVEASFRMSKTDLRARPVFHHTRESIEAHLTIVFAALAVARYLQDATGSASRRSCVRSVPCSRSPSVSPATTTSPKTPSPQPQRPSSRPSTSTRNDVPRWHESGRASAGTLLESCVLSGPEIVPTRDSLVATSHGRAIRLHCLGGVLGTSPHRWTETAESPRFQYVSGCHYPQSLSAPSAQRKVPGARGRQHPGVDDGAERVGERLGPSYPSRPTLPPRPRWCWCAGASARSTRISRAAMPPPRRLRRALLGRVRRREGSAAADRRNLREVRQTSNPGPSRYESHCASPPVTARRRPIRSIRAPRWLPVGARRHPCREAKVVHKA
jgi:hypothetical protein